jgi:hypothetical protein
LAIKIQPKVDFPEAKGVIMKNTVVLFLALSLTVMGSVAFASPLGDEAEACWQKGVQAALLSKDYVPGRFYMKFEQLDGDGKTKDQKETWMKLLPGEKEVQVVKVLKNGKDVTKETLAEEQEKNKAAEKKKESGNSINLANEEIVPFLSNSKKPVVHNYLGRQKINGADCLVFEFRKEHIRKKGTTKETVVHQGKLWLDAASGMPVRTSFSPTPLPSMVKQMDMDATFVPEGDTFFVKDYKMLIKAGFLFLAKRFRISFVLGAYRKSEKENQ